MDVLLRLDLGGGGLAHIYRERVVNRVAIQRGLGVRQATLMVADANHPDMGALRLAAVEIVVQRDSGHGEIAAAAGVLLKAPAARGRPWRQTDLGDDLVGREPRSERTLEEVGRLDGAGAALADHRELGLAGLGDTGHL